MFRRFCTILFFLLLVGGLLYWQVVRRGKEASAHPGQAAVPALDLRRSEALLKAANAFLDDDQDGMTLAKEAASKGDALRLAELLATQERQRELFRQANQLLHERRFNELEELLNQAEERGTASPRLLELRGVPQALQALALFCARRPYQNADDLRVSLDFLQPYLPVLSESPRFQQFYQEQKTLLADLERAGRHAKTLAILQDLDWCQATAGRAQQCLPLLKELAGTDADAFLLRLLGDVAHPQPSALFGESLSPTDGAEPLATDPLSQASLELA